MMGVYILGKTMCNLQSVGLMANAVSLDLSKQCRPRLSCLIGVYTACNSVTTF